MHADWWRLTSRAESCLDEKALVFRRIFCSTVHAPTRKQWLIHIVNDRPFLMRPASRRFISNTRYLPVRNISTLRSTRCAPSSTQNLQPSRGLAQVRPDREVLAEAYFTPSNIYQQGTHHASAQNSRQQPDERTLKLGKSTKSYSPAI